MSTPTFEERVRELVNEGKLTPAEAEELLGGPRPAREPRVEAKVVAPGEAPLRVIVDVCNASIRVRGRSGLTEPRLVRAAGGVMLTPTAAGWMVGPPATPEPATAFDWMKLGLRAVKPGTIELEVPDRLERLEVSAMAGDIEVLRVSAHVRAHLTFGDVELDGVSGFEVTVRSGDARVRACVTEGRHRIHLLNGDADLVLERGSSAHLDLSTATGEIDARRPLITAEPWRRTHRLVVGSGGAHVQIETITGDVVVDVREEA
jgi:hypothetical protein